MLLGLRKFANWDVQALAFCKNRTARGAAKSRGLPRNSALKASALLKLQQSNSSVLRSEFRIKIDMKVSWHSVNVNAAVVNFRITGVIINLRIAMVSVWIRSAATSSSYSSSWAVLAGAICGGSGALPLYKSGAGLL